MDRAEEIEVCVELEAALPTTLDGLHRLVFLEDGPPPLDIPPAWIMIGLIPAVKNISETMVPTSTAGSEYELLIARLTNYALLPTTTVGFDRQPAEQWNRLTLMRDVTIVNEESHIEQSLFGCILRKIELISIDEWNDSVHNGGKLHHKVADKFKVKSIEVNTLMGLLWELWIRGEIPLILKTHDSLPILGEYSHLNKSYIIIDSAIEKRHKEITSYNLKVLSHISDIESEKLLKIMTSDSVASKDKYAQKDGIYALKSLHIAVIIGDVQTIKTLLELRKDVNSIDKNGYTPLHYAVEYKHEDILQILLENQAAVNTITKQGNTPLITAVEEDHDTILKILLDHQADINFVNNCGLTALYVAALEWKWQIVSLLLSEGATAEVPAAQAVLFNAVKTNNCKVVQKLFRDYKGIGYDDIPNDIARYDDTQNLIKTVSEDRANVNVIDECGVFPLHRAVAAGYKDMVNILLRYNANANLVDSWYTSSYCCKERRQRHLQTGNKREGDNKDIENSPLSALTTSGGTRITETQKLPQESRFSKKHVNCDTSIQVCADSNNEDHSNPASVENPQLIKVDNLNDKYRDNLYIAVDTGNLELVKSLLSSGADVNSAGNNGYTPLIAATERRIVNIAQELLDNKAQVNLAGECGITPLYVAALIGDLDMVSLLLQYGATADFIESGHNILFNALESGIVNIVEKLLVVWLKERNYTANGSLNKSSEPKNLIDTVFNSRPVVDSINEKGLTPLIRAIERNDVVMVRKLLEYGAHVDKTDDAGVSPLSYAIKMKNKDIIDVILQSGANINHKSPDHSTLLHVAVETEEIQAVKELLRHGVEVNCVNDAGFTPLCAAVKTEYVDIINMLLTNQADANLVGNDGVAPLIIAIEKNNIGIIQLLLVHDADPNLIDECGLTPLYVAALRGDWFVVSILLLTDPYTNIITCGKTLLFNAVRIGSSRLVKLLLDTQPTGTTTFTVFNEITMIIEEVLGSRATINDVNEQGFSPLHVAVGRRNLAMVELLLEYRANVNLCDNFGCTPLDIAKDTKQKNIIKVLSKQQSNTNSKCMH
ncbi:molting protein mlt-4 [Holotrichia oblita]|uniref:Molting protein mlt-4 n=1 Tax=Holotrichia oblita TaxID=644536 RepID=A0ACB9SG19_HOLOL|nr:molting protein mlt-4 [Holotrichia oblita]